MSANSNDFQLFHLPTEILLGIFSYLSYVDIANLSAVNKEFNQIFRDNSFWQKKLKTHFPDVFADLDSQNPKINYYICFGQAYAAKYKTITNPYTKDLSDDAKKTAKELISAVKDSNLDLVEEIITKKSLTFSDLFCADVDNKSIANWASNKKDRDISAYFYKLAANFYFHKAKQEKKEITEVVDFYGNFLLHWAVQFHQIEWVEKLIKETKFNVKAKNEKKETPLFLAVSLENVDIVSLLIKEKANVNEPAAWSITPLHKAVRLKNFTLVETLLSAGANVDFPDAMEATALVIAVTDGLADIVKLLNTKKANFNIRLKHGKTLLFIATQYGHLDIVKYLVEQQKADINITLPFTKETPFLIALENEHFATALWLLQNGANIEVTLPNDMTPLILVAKSNSPAALTIAEALLKKKGIDVNAVSSHEKITALHMATQHDNLKMVQLLLLEKTINLNLEYKSSSPLQSQETSLHLAVNEGFVDIAECLLARGAMVDCGKKTGATPLLIAAHNNNSKMMHLLLNYHADVNVPFLKTGDTALHFMAKHGDLIMIKSLLKYGADPLAVTHEGKKPSDYAQNPEVKKVLLEAECNFKLNDFFNKHQSFQASFFNKKVMAAKKLQEIIYEGKYKDELEPRLETLMELEPHLEELEKKDLKEIYQTFQSMRN